jgi:hypothetical protein
MYDITLAHFSRQKSNNIAFGFWRARGYGYPPAHGSAQPTLAGILVKRECRACAIAISGVATGNST